MPACSSETACLKGLWSSKTAGTASPQCLGSHLTSSSTTTTTTTTQLYKTLRSHHNSKIHNGISHSIRQQQQQQQSQQQKQIKKASYIRRLIARLLRVFHKILTYSLLAPVIWVSAWLCLGWFILRMPLNFLKFFLRFLSSSKQHHFKGKLSAGTERCVLISGGSTVQSVQLARNLSANGMRVVVCELEGLFGLARFSRACARFYTLPRPLKAGAAAYVSGLKDIVLREGVKAYIPVSASSPAYYDGLAKPHLEVLGCECLVPGAASLALLDDPVELLRRSRLLGLPTPQHRLITNGGLEEVSRLLESGALAGARHWALPAGPEGLRERRPELMLPSSSIEFARQRQQLERQQPHAIKSNWLVIRDPGGTHFITCTSIRDSRLVTSVTCRVTPDGSSNLVLEENPNVNRWLEKFFSRGFASGKFSGHLSFRLASSLDKSDQVVGISCRVGIGLAYLGHSSLQTTLLLSGYSHQYHLQQQQHRLICRHARLKHQQQQQQQQAADISMKSAGNKFLNKREALFLYWDPLPYCVFCYLQLPFGKIVGVLRAQQSQHQPPLAVVQ